MLPLLLGAPSALAAPFFFFQPPDPYQVHLEQLEDLITDEPTSGLLFAMGPTGDYPLTGVIGPVGQIDDGVVTLKAAGVDVGTVWGEVVDPDYAEGHHREHWVLHDTGLAATPNASFELEMLHPLAGPGVAMDAMPAGWQADPYAAIDFVYTDKPDPSETDDMTYDGTKVTRYLFALLQDPAPGTLVAYRPPPVGYMLRERHVTAEGTSFVEHWLFYDGFSMLDEVGESVRVKHLAGKTPAHAAAFFATYATDDVRWYSQANYAYAPNASGFPGL